MTGYDIQALTDAVLRPILEGAGFSSSEIRSRQDHAGEDALHVTVHFRPGARVADGMTLLTASVALQEALARHGESRFPYFRYDYADDAPPFDTEEAYGSGSDGPLP